MPLRLSGRPLVALIPLVGLLLAPGGVGAQTQTSLTASTLRARALLDSAVAAHGGADALRAARQIRVRLEGHDVHRNQSRRTSPPYDREPHTVDLMIDLDHSRISFERTMTYPGGAHRTQRFLTDSARSWLVNRRARTASPQRYPAASAQFGNLFYIPQFILAAAGERPDQLRFLGSMVLSNGAPVEVIVAPLTGGGLVTLGIDPANKRLRALLSVRGDAVAGDATSEIEFIDYRMLGGLLLPGRRVSRVAGEVTLDLAYVDVQPGFVMPDSLAVPPAGFGPPPADAPIEEARTLAPGVWSIGGSGANSLVVEFRDHLLVVDAPFFGASDVLARTATLAPGKPVRYLVPTHHHDDHAGGIAHYAAAGATIVTTRGNRDLFARMADVRPSFGPRTPKAMERAPVIEVMSGRRTFSDGVRTLEIHDIGPGPHAEEMLVAWLPAERILFQADLIDVGANGAILPGLNNETTVHFGKWLRRRGWGVRVFAGSHGFLRGPEGFAMLLSQPTSATD